MARKMGYVTYTFEELGGIDLTVCYRAEGTFYPTLPETRTDPGEPAHWEWERVEIHHGQWDEYGTYQVSWMDITDSPLADFICEKLDEEAERSGM